MVHVPSCISACVLLWGNIPERWGLSPAYWSVVKKQVWLAALTEKQQSPLKTGGRIAVIGPTLRAIEPLMANSVCSPL